MSDRQYDSYYRRARAGCVGPGLGDEADPGRTGRRPVRQACCCSGGERQAARARVEAELDEHPGEARSERRLAVDPLERELPKRPARTASASATSASRSGSSSRDPVASRVSASVSEAAPAALDVQRGADPRRAPPAHRRRAPGVTWIPRAWATAGPPVWLGRIGGSDDERARACTLAGVSGSGAQPLDGAGERELRAAHALDEVARRQTPSVSRLANVSYSIAKPPLMPSASTCSRVTMP